MKRGKNEEDKKNIPIQIKVTPKTKKDFEIYAERKGYSLTYLIEMSVREAIRRKW